MPLKSLVASWLRESLEVLQWLRRPLTGRLRSAREQFRRLFKNQHRSLCIVLEAKLGHLLDTNRRQNDHRRQDAEYAKTYKQLFNRFAHAAGPVHLAVVDYLFSIIVYNKHNEEAHKQTHKQTSIQTNEQAKTETHTQINKQANKRNTTNAPISIQVIMQSV